MKIALTGGAGFIASHIVDAYIAAGHEVTVIDNLSSGFRENIHPQARFECMDIRDEGIADLFAREGFDVLNHHAAQIDVRVSVQNPKLDAMVNVIGGLNLYEAAAAGGVKKIIFASSGGTVYGEQTAFPCNEEHPTHPLSPYGVAKLANEHYLYALQHTAGIDYVALRYANIYGPRQNPHGEAGVIAIFLHKMLRGERPIINGDGLQTRDYLFVHDAVAANLLALQPEVRGSYNFSTGIETNVVEIFHAIREAIGADFPEVHGESKAGEQRRSSNDYSLVYEQHGWKPQVSFREGIRQTAAWFAQKIRNNPTA